MKNRPDQTLRQYLDEKYYRDGPLGLVMIIAVIALPLWIGTWLKGHARYLGWVVPLIFPVAVWASRRWVGLRPCPRCRHFLGELASMHTSVEGACRKRDPFGERYRLEQLGGCPHCGLKLDERILPRG